MNKPTKENVAAMIYARAIDINPDAGEVTVADYTAALERCTPIAQHAFVAAEIFIQTMNEINSKENENN